MRPGGGGPKGSDYERSVARKLTKWMTGSSKPEVVWRTSTSCAKHTQDVKKGIKGGKMPGDLMSISKVSSWFAPPDGVFVIECKNVKKLDLLGMFLSQGNLTKWWRKLMGLSVITRLLPIMILHQNFKPDLISFSVQEWGGFCEWFGPFHGSTVRIDGAFGVVFCQLDDWFRWVDAKSLKRHLGRGRR